MNIAITGANGFVGRHLCQHLFDAGHNIHAITRQAYQLPAHQCRVIDYSDQEALLSALRNIDIVIHLAGIAHSRGIAPEQFYQVNTYQTLTIAQAAITAGVKQFIFCSSIKVNGDVTGKKPFRYDDTPKPEDHYGKSKWLAEQKLATLCRNSRLQLLILRPTLIYGDKPKGNLQSLNTALRFHIPLPLKDTQNKRDMVSLDNFASLLDKCFLKTSLDGKVLLVADGAPFSTSQLVEQIASKQNITPLLFHCPRLIQSLLKRLSITRGIYQRLFGNLEVDIRNTMDLTGWAPQPVATIDMATRRG